MPSGIQRQWNASIAAIQQTDLGVFGAGGGANLIPITGGRGNLSMDAIPSLQVRQDGQTVRGRHGTHKTKGDYKGELQGGNYDWVLEAIMRSTWQVGAAPNLAGGDLLTNPGAGNLVRRYFTVEEHEFDIAASEVYYDCVMSMFGLTMKPNGMVDTDFSWVGTGNLAALDATSATPPPILTAPTYPLLNAIPMASLDATVNLSDLGVVLDLTAFSLKIDLKATAPPVAGSQFSPDVFDGMAQVSGSMTIMRRDLIPLRDAIAETTIILSATLAIPGGANKLRFTVPFMTYQSAEKSEFKRDGGPLTVTVPFPEQLVGVDTTPGNPATMIQIERLNV